MRSWSCKISCSPGLARQVALKKTKVKLDLLTDIDMLVMLAKDIRGGICHSIYWYGKANKKYIKHYYRNKESSYLKYWDVNKLYGREMSQKLQKIILIGSKILLNLMKISWKTITKKVMRDIFSNLMFNLQEN